MAWRGTQKKKKKSNDSPRESQSAGIGAAAMGRSQGLDLRIRSLSQRYSRGEFWELEVATPIVHTTSVLVHFGGVDKRHGGEGPTDAGVNGN